MLVNVVYFMDIIINYNYDIPLAIASFTRSASSS